MLKKKLKHYLLSEQHYIDLGQPKSGASGPGCSEPDYANPK